MGKHGKKKNGETKGEVGTDDKPLPKLVLKVNKEQKKQEHKKHKESKHRENRHESAEADHSHHKKKKKKHKNREKEKDKNKDKDNDKDIDKDRSQEKEKKSRKRELAPEPSEHETPSKKPHHLRNKEKEKKDLPREKDIPPLALCLGNMLRNLQRKDVYNIFQLPVSDAVAPGYSKVIKQPMDFTTMLRKIECSEYGSIEDMKSDFVLMCNNAMLYNGPDTIYYKSADKMLSIGLKTLSKEKMHKVSKSLGLAVSDSEDDVIQIEDTEVNILDPVNTSAEEAPMPKKKSEKKRKNKEKNREQKLMIESILSAAHKARQKLLENRPNQLYGYLSIDEEGKNSYNILNPDSTEESRPVELTLEKLAPPPKTGLPAGQPFKQDKKSRVVPVNYLLYGPYGSFGPIYDSSLSNTTKQDSDLLLQTYGSEMGVSYTKSVQDFTGDSVFTSGFADRLLDTITGGKHSAMVDTLKAKEKEEADKENKGNKTLKENSSKTTAPKPTTATTTSATAPTTTSKDTASDPEVDFESLLTLDGLGIDVSFIKEFVKDAKDTKPAPPPASLPSAEQVLSQNADLLNNLRDEQNKRLSSKQGGTIPVGQKELQTATSLVGNLKELLKVTKPEDTVPSFGVKKAIGSDQVPSVRPMVVESEEKAAE